MNIRSYIPFSADEAIFGILVFISVTFFVAESRWARLNNSKAISSEDKVHLYLKEPAGLDTLYARLTSKGVRIDKEELLWAANLLGWKKIREGHYLIDQGFSYDQFLSKLARGIQDPISITILPGKSKGDIVKSISTKFQFDSLAFQKTLKDSVILRKYDLEEKDVIGRLLPNTYSVFWTSSPKSIFTRILKEFRKSVSLRFQKRFKELDYTVNEIVTLASIVEWEAQTREEQPIISGLYWNRLDRGMRLQADPTVNYAVGERRRLLYEDYKVGHPYNTYIHRGLPPGPITNPSLSAIKAALFPADHDYLYMVATPKGTHAFSETFEEHKKKSAKWREWLQEQYRIKRKLESESNQQ